ncbi:MAG: LL-diaminopimelate aminotransferase [Clostridiales bacterium]|nr:LL-diaminopimelate aminotransferase [Clostridiales bacterium]
MKLNRNFKNLKENYLFAEVSKRVDAYKAEFPNSDIISLGIGDVTIPLSQKAVEACKDSAIAMSTKSGFKGYGPYDGYDFLKNAIVDYYKKRGVKIEADEVFVTDGAKNGIGNFLDLFDAGNTVMIPDPVYPAYVDANVLAGHKVVYVDATKENKFLAMPPKRGKADIIYICSPNNPTGAAYTKDQLKEWVDFALDKQAVILYDAAYEAYINGKTAARSIFEVTGARDCAVEFCSFSKMAGFTGVRCGWTVIPMSSPLNRMWLHRQAIKFNGTSYVVQRMAESMLKEGFDDSLKMVEAYKKNAKIITDKFDALGIEYTGGEHAPYIWFNCGIDSWQFFDYMLKKARIVCTPGSGFGRNGNGWIRLTSFNSKERTEEAVSRFVPFWKEFVEVRNKLFTVVN